MKATKKSTDTVIIYTVIIVTEANWLGRLKIFLIILDYDVYYMIVETSMQNTLNFRETVVCLTMLLCLTMFIL